MNDTLSNGVHDNEVDQLLQTFFRREMPQPWPQATAAAPTGVSPPRRSWFQRYGRLAVAASVLLVLLSYLGLAAFFPDQGAPSLNYDPGQNIGKKADRKPLPPSVQPIPANGDHETRKAPRKLPGPTPR